jgi:hypothetical protein
MQLWRYPDVELSRIVPPRLNTLLTTHLKEHLQRPLELCPKLLGRPSIEVSTPIQAKDLSTEHIKLSIVLDLSLIAIHRHYVHDTTPCCCNHVRMLVTAPLSVLGLG